MTRLALATALTASMASAQAPAPRRASSDRLEEQFRNPPASARPKVWWHWLNGNVTKDGIAKDLAWMKRIGIGGVQNFDATLNTPQIVSQRLVYMSPEWKEAFRFAVSTAARLGLSFGIAASPGFSETGGPWVAPEDGMKKLVWSEALLTGGVRFAGVLPSPPSATGPFQGITSAAAHGGHAPPIFYRDAKVLAYPVTGHGPLSAPSRTLVNGAAIDAAPLLDGDLASGIPLPASTGQGPGTVAVSFAAPQTVRSALVSVANVPRRGASGPLAPLLEASDDGATWRTVAQFGGTEVPETVSFAPATARHFRLVMTRGKRTDNNPASVPAPGADSRALAVGTIFGSTKRGPPTLAEFRLTSEARVNAAEQKAGFALADDYYKLDAHVGDDPAGVAPASVVDLTARMSADGRLDWTPPRGRWKVVRLGWSLTGKTNHPATPEATGLEVDKYDRAAVERCLRTYLGMYRDVTGEALMGRSGLSELVTDSTEVGASNWTPTLIEQFRRLRGYDPTPWLPALTGEIVGSRKRSDAFLYDFRRTLADLAATEHYGTVARVAHQFGLTVYGESLEGGRLNGTLGDDIDMRRFADVPMGAMWTFGGEAPGPDDRGDVRGAASVAHLYGRPLVAAESLTSMLNPFAHAPGDLQPMIDAAFADGVNRPAIHTSVHQPVDDKQPGLSLGVFGQFFTRHETWAEMARPWVDYPARSSFMLQQGRNVADVAYFYGEEAPIRVQAGPGYPADVPRRYAYDFVSAEGLTGELTVEGGDLVSRGGARYRALYLGGTSSQMTLPVLRKLAALVESGATVVGRAPERSPNMADDPAAFAALVKRLWPGGAEARIGRGWVIAGTDVEAALTTIGVAPDFAYAGGQNGGQLAFVHRALADGDVYFVTNRKNQAERVEARFRVAGKLPEVWHADSGAREPVSYRIAGAETVVPLELAPLQSVFVVLRKPAPAASAEVPARSESPLGPVGGPWKVAFQSGRGAPSEILLARLGALSDHAEAGVRYFSGVATYTTSFALPQGSSRAAPLLLDLGKVGDVAEVRVNGRLAGIAWKAPYRVAIGELVRPGRNTLEVRVANLWVNRLIGDQQPGAAKVAFTSVPTYLAQAPLRPSGLIGPVTLVGERR